MLKKKKKKLNCYACLYKAVECNMSERREELGSEKNWLSKIKEKKIATSTSSSPSTERERRRTNDNRLQRK